MEIKMGQRLQMRQQLQLTPQLMQAIKILHMSRMELTEHIDQELLENPMLDIAAEGELVTAPPDGAPVESIGAQTEVTAAPEAPSEGEASGERDDASVLLEQYLEYEDFRDSDYSPSDRLNDDEMPPFEANLTSPESLQEHLLWQLTTAGLDERDTLVADSIIGNINDDGYFVGDLDEFATEFELPRDEVEWVLEKVQEFDPLGVGARDLRECLLLQAEQLHPHDFELHAVIDRHLGSLEKRDYSAVMKDVGLDLDGLKEIMTLINRLEPKPGRQFAANDNQYVTPDVYIRKVGDEYVVQLNDDGLPRLRMNAAYKDLARREGAGPGATKEANGEVKNYVAERWRSAQWLIRSIYQRQSTIRKVTESIVRFQRDFFDFGVEHLKPLILRDVAQDIGMHEATISRVTNLKFVHTPQGIFELKYFFNSRITSTAGSDDMASEAVKQIIKKLIDDEPMNKPHSDQKLVEMLAERNIEIARRTVAKYREMLGIESSSKRKRLI